MQRRWTSGFVGGMRPCARGNGAYGAAADGSAATRLVHHRDANSFQRHRLRCRGLCCGLRAGRAAYSGTGAAAGRVGGGAGGTAGDPDHRLAGLHAHPLALAVIARFRSGHGCYGLPAAHGGRGRSVDAAGRPQPGGTPGTVLTVAAPGGSGGAIGLRVVSLDSGAAPAHAARLSGASTPVTAKWRRRL